MDAPGLHALVAVDPGVVSGTPVFRGTRVPVKNLFDYLGSGESLDAFLEQFPSVTREQALGVLKLAGSVVCANADEPPAG